MILLGVGRLGAAIARRTPGCVGTTRSLARVGVLRSLGVEPVLTAGLDVGALTRGRDVVVSFPPDGATDAAWAPACDARRLVYVSSTGVYPDGAIDEHTPADAASPRAQARLDAEGLWRDRGAAVVRAAAIYGPGFGLHERVRTGVHVVPGDGSNVISRVHVDDLATIVLAALSRGRPGATYLAADLAPAPHGEVVAWIVARLGVAPPRSAPPEQVAATLRGSRAVDPRATLAELDVTLKHPTYRDGIGACLDAAPPAPNG